MKKYIIHFSINFILILLSFIFNQFIILVPFVYSAFLIVIEKNPNKKIFPILFFLPFAVVFKLNPEMFSLFTLLQIIYVGIMLINQKLNTNLVLCIIIFLLYIVMSYIRSYTFDLLLVSDLVIGILTISFMMTAKPKVRDITIFFTFGLLSSITLSLFLDVIPRLNEFVLYNSLYLNSSLNEYRNSGLWVDPNIHGLFIVISLSLILSTKNISSYSKFALFSILLLFGLSTFSKTFLLIIILVIFYVIIYNLKRNYIKGILFILIIVIISFFIVRYNILGFYDLYLLRFKGISDNFSIISLTTNRSIYWSAYISSLQNPITLLFGNGLFGSLPLNAAAHNTVLQILYLIGVTGTILLIFIFLNLKGMVKRNMNLSRISFSKSLPLVVLSLYSLTLDLFTHQFFYIFLGIAFITFTTDYDGGHNNDENHL